MTATDTAFSEPVSREEFAEALRHVECIVERQVTDRVCDEADLHGSVPFRGAVTRLRRCAGFRA